jgi:hypothetical protein
MQSLFVHNMAIRGLRQSKNLITIAKLEKYKIYGIESRDKSRDFDHRLSIDRKCGKENSSSDGHCQCQKEMDYHLLAC